MFLTVKVYFPSYQPDQHQEFDEIKIPGFLLITQIDKHTSNFSNGQDLKFSEVTLELEHNKLLEAQVERVQCTHIHERWPAAARASQLSAARQPKALWSLICVPHTDTGLKCFSGKQVRSPGRPTTDSAGGLPACALCTVHCLPGSCLL